MALSMGIFQNEGFTNQNINTTTTYDALLSKLSDDDYMHIRFMVATIDLMNSYFTGITGMIPPNSDTISVTKLIPPLWVDLLYFYRSSFRLVHANDMVYVGQRNEIPLTSSDEFNTVFFFHLKECESFVEAYEILFRSTMNSFKFTSDSLNLTGISLLLTISNLMCFQYCSSYKFVSSHLQLMQNDPSVSPNELNQMKRLEVRVFRRSLRFCILKLAIINNLLVNLSFNQEYFSARNITFPLVEMFTKTIFILSVTTVRLIVEQKSNSEFYQMFKELTKCEPTNDTHLPLNILNIKMSLIEDVRFCGLNQQTNQVSDEVKLISKQLDQIIISPSSTINTMLGFYFNCSQTILSHTFEFVVTYKYLTLMLKTLNESNFNHLEDFNLNQFLKSIESMGVTSFVSN